MAPLGHLGPEEGHHLLHVSHFQQARLAALQNAHHYLQACNHHHAGKIGLRHSLPVCCHSRMQRSLYAQGFPRRQVQ